MAKKLIGMDKNEFNHEDTKVENRITYKILLRAYVSSWLNLY